MKKLFGAVIGIFACLCAGAASTAVMAQTPRHLDPGAVAVGKELPRGDVVPYAGREEAIVAAGESSLGGDRGASEYLRPLTVWTRGATDSTVVFKTRYTEPTDICEWRVDGMIVEQKQGPFHCRMNPAVGSNIVRVACRIVFPDGTRSGWSEEVLVTVAVPTASSPLFDNVRVDIIGSSWKVVNTVQIDFPGGNGADSQSLDQAGNLLVANLPTTISLDKLFSSASGWWHASSSQVSDANARVAGLGDIIVYRGDQRVGRLYLSDWDKKNNPLGASGTYIVYYHYTDRPFTCGPVAFVAGWNAYAKTGGSTPMANIPSGLDLHWRFEQWP